MLGSIEILYESNSNFFVEKFSLTAVVCMRIPQVLIRQVEPQKLRDYVAILATE